MGIYIYKVACTACDFSGTAREGISSYSYLLPDGDTAPVTVDCAWCSDCNTVVDAERIRSEADIARELFEFETGGPARESFLEAIRELRDPTRVLDFQVSTLRSLLEWRQLRTTPAHCLECGSSNIDYLACDKVSTLPTIRHPGCGGSLVLTLHAHGSGPRKVFYSVEALPLHEE